MNPLDCVRANYTYFIAYTNNLAEKTPASEKALKAAEAQKAQACEASSASPAKKAEAEGRFFFSVNNEMDGESEGWEKAYWSNGDPFNATWTPDAATFQDGKLTLTLSNNGCPQSCDMKPYSSAEYRTRDEEFTYGHYQTRMKAAKGSGLVTSFFVYAGTYGQPSHNEIDIEVLGKDCNAVQFNYYAAGKGGHEKVVQLGFDACQDFHEYGFTWHSDGIVWEVDGEPVHRVAGYNFDLPKGQTKIMMNLWPGKGVDGWLGSFNYPGHPITAQYDWVKVASRTQKQPTLMPKLPETALQETAATSNTEKLSNLAWRIFGFNGGKISRLGTNSFRLQAESKRDPGFGIEALWNDMRGKKQFVFDAKGSVTRNGSYARLIVQVYNSKDNDSRPSITLDPISVGPDQKTFSVPLRGKVLDLKKVQFLLVTDKGSCDVEVSNLRFE